MSQITSIELGGPPKRSAIVSGRPNSSRVINLKMTKALGLAIPQAVLLRADEVIE